MNNLNRNIFNYITALISVCITGVSGTDYISKVTAEHGMMCGCKNIFLVKHFDVTGSEIYPNATWQSTVTYGGSAGSYSVLTPDAGDYSVFTIPDDVVDCYMKGRLSRLSAYYKTDKGEFLEVAGEYTVSGTSHTIQSIRSGGAPFWKKFDFYFDFTGISNTITDVKLNIKSPSSTVPVYIDELVICTFCDGTVGQDGPGLSSLSVTPGIWNIPFRTDEHYYSINVDKNVSTVNVTPVFSGTGSPVIRVKGTVVSSGATIPVTIGSVQSAPIDINIRESACVQTNYLLQINKSIQFDATLSDLVPSIGHLTTIFAPNTFSYQLVVPYGTASVKLKPLATDPSSSITVNGVSVKTGTESNSIDITTTATITIIVIANDGITTSVYTVTAMEEAPQISFTVGSGTGFENVTNPVITVKINPVPVAGKTYTVQYAVDIGASTASGSGVDFTLNNGSLSFTNTSATRTISPTIVNDAVVGEGAETIVIKLMNPTNGASLGTPNVYIYTIGEVLYVKSGSAGNGTSWSSAFGSLQDALAAAIRGSEIWIAGANTTTGLVYKPGPVGSPRTVTFSPRAGVSILGGFPGNAGEEGRKELQNWKLYKTVLDGDLAGDDGTIWPRADINIDDNVYHVINIYNHGYNTENEIRFSGLSIVNGNNDTYSLGSGMLIVKANVKLTDCLIMHNHSEDGAGIGAVKAALEIDRTTVAFNRADHNGGGISIYGMEFDEPPEMKLRLVNSFITDNEASEEYGGGIYLYEPINTYLENNVISRNHADLQQGGGVYCSWYRTGDFKIINCTFTANSSFMNGGGLYVEYGFSELVTISPVAIVNTIFYENTTYYGATQALVYQFDVHGTDADAIVNYSSITGGITSSNIEGVVKPGIGNIDCNPDFLSLTNYQIGNNSNCIDKGTSIGTPQKDIEGKLRYDHPVCPNVQSEFDIGAYEYRPAP